jgi:ABC-2 type transport system permease protein
MLTTYLPAFMLSGFIFAIPNMPPVLQGITYLFAARYFVTITKGIFLKGTGLDELWVSVLSLAVYALMGLALAWRAFRKEIAA